MIVERLVREVRVEHIVEVLYSVLLTEDEFAKVKSILNEDGTETPIVKAPRITSIDASR